LSSVNHMTAPLTDAKDIDWGTALYSVSHVIVDFDETLLLTNSTEAYLGSARPLHLVMAICKAIDILRLWSYLPGERKRHVYRDWLRVVFVTLFMPWHYFYWRGAKAAEIGRTRSNQDLMEILDRAKECDKLVVSLGFGFIIRPLLSTMAPGYGVRASSMLSGFRLRRDGKLRLLQDHVGLEYIKQSAVITDSHNDIDILNACAVPILIAWENTVVDNIFSKAYIPFLYTEKVKRKGGRYMWRGVIQQDCVALCLAYAWAMPNPVFACLSIVGLHLALWCIYELGYFDNDKAAVEKEVNGNVIPEYHDFIGRMSLAGAWMAAAAFTAFGVVAYALAFGSMFEAPHVAALSLEGIALVAIKWLGILFISQLIFRAYNRVSGDVRILTYPLLQVLRLGLYAILFTTSVPGILLLSAFVIGRSIPYIVYRASGLRWGTLNRLLVLITFFYTSLIALSTSYTLILTYQWLVILVWLILRSRVEIVGFYNRPAALSKKAV